MLLEDNLKIKHICEIDVSDVIESISQLPSYLWDLNTSRSMGKSPHYDTKSLIWKECNHNPMTNTISGMFYKIEDTLDKLTFQIVDILEKKFDGISGKVIYAKLPAGKSITPHKDPGYYLSIVHRIHVPITTNDGVNFYFDGELVKMQVNNCYEINNQLTHSVDNLGDTDRIHLIIDIVPNTYFE